MRCDGHGYPASLAAWYSLASTPFTASVGSAAGAGLLILAAEATCIYFVVTLVLPIVRRRLPLAQAGTSMLLVRYPEGHGILRRVLNEATQRGFVIDDLATEPADGRKDGDGPSMVAVTMHVHGKRPLQQWDCRFGHFAASQTWYLDPAVPTRIVSEIGGRCLEVAGGSLVQGAYLQTYHPNNPAQIFVVGRGLRKSGTGSSAKRS